MHPAAATRTGPEQHSNKPERETDSEYLIENSAMASYNAAKRT